MSRVEGREQREALVQSEWVYRVIRWRKRYSQLGVCAMSLFPYGAYCGIARKEAGIAMNNVIYHAAFSDSSRTTTMQRHVRLRKNYRAGINRGSNFHD